MDDREQLWLGLVFGGIAPILVAAAMVAIRDDIVATNAALVLVLIVVAASVIGGGWAGALAALTATLSFDYFLTQPYLSLTITSSDDAETTVLLLVIALAVGYLTARTKRSRAAERRGRDEIARIHRLAELVAHGRDSTAVLMAAQDELSSLLELKACRFETPPYVALLARLERNGTLSGPLPGSKVAHRRFARGGFELPEDGVELPVLTRGSQVGRFVLEPTSGIGTSLEQRVVAVALSDQVGAALSSPTALALESARPGQTSTDGSG
jgi:hypothetical protein